MTEFRFRRIDVSARSALAAELAPDCRKGLYLYIFNDGSAYVGKSVDLVRRYGDHLEEYRHRVDFEGVEIERAYFMVVDEDTDDCTLDRLETMAIRRAASEGYNLRNIQKMDLPGGSNDAVFELSEQKMRLLPWKRRDRTNDLTAAVLLAPSPSQLQRMDRLMASVNGALLLDLATRYIHETVQEAANTAGLYWTANAFPSRTETPALCVTCGTLETLVVFDDGARPFGYLNMKRPEGDKGSVPTAPWRTFDYGYKATGGIVTYEFSCLEELRWLLDRGRILDWCYRLNIEMFRHCKNPLGAKGNPVLMKRLLDGAASNKTFQNSC